MDLFVDKGCVIYEENSNKHKLFDFMNLLNNKSSVPMIKTIYENVETWIEFIDRIVGECANNIGESYQGYNVDADIIFIILCDALARTSKPVNVLEYGCADGALSYLLATAMGKTNRKSKLYCLSDIIDNRWQEEIAKAELLPDVNYIAANYTHTGLQRESFDIVIINGATYFEEPKDVIIESLKLLKNDGLLICYSRRQPLLDSCFQLYFEKRRQYNLDARHIIQVAKKSDICFDLPDENAIPQYLIRLENEAKEYLAAETPAQNGDELAKKINDGVDLAIAIMDLEMKQRLIDLKEEVIKKLLGL